MPARVLQVITDRDRRGAQVFAADLAEALDGQGWNVRTVALADGSTSARLDVPALEQGTRRITPGSLRRLRHEMAAAEVTIAHGSTTLFAVAIAGTGLGRPRVYRQISDSQFWAPTRIRRERVGLAMRRYDRIVALHPGAADTLVEHFGVARDRLVVVPNGAPADRYPRADTAAQLDARQRLGLDRSGPVLVSVSALVPEKGVDVAIEATGRLPEATLLIVGDGPERNHLEALAQRTAPDRIRFTGPVDSPLDAYRAADVVLLPSRGGDSMPAALIEAGFVGRPAVSTPVAGIPEIVRDGTTGRLVPIGDAGALAAAVATVLGDLPTFGEAAYRHCIDQFEIGTVARAWGAVVGPLAPQAVPNRA